MSIYERIRVKLPEYSFDPKANELVNNNKDLQTAWCASYLAGIILQEAFNSTYKKPEYVNAQHYN